MSLPPENRLVAMSRLVALGLVAETLVEQYYYAQCESIWDRSRRASDDIFRLAIECAVKIRCIRAIVDTTGGAP